MPPPLTEMAVANWISVELPSVQNLRVDLLGETVQGRLLQIELQTNNDPNMPFRMLEYLMAVRRSQRRIPEQVVLYAGRDPFNMPDRFVWPHGEARYGIIDLRELDAEPFLSSPAVSANIFGILTKLRDQREAVRGVLARIAGLDPDEAGSYYAALKVLAGLRELETIVEEEVERMPLDLESLIKGNSYLEPAYNRGLQEGLHKGEQNGELKVLRRQIERRFGRTPSWAEQRLSAYSSEQLLELGDRLLEAVSLEDLLRP